MYPKSWLKQSTAWTIVHIEKLSICTIGMQLDGAQRGRHHSHFLGTRRCNSIWFSAKALSHQHSGWSSHTSDQVTACALVPMQLLPVGGHVLLLCLFSLLASAVLQLMFPAEAGSVGHVIMMKLLYTCHAGMTATSEVQRDCSK